MKKILILPLLLFFLIQGSMAQTPKWVEKAKRAVFSVVTYDKNDKMLNTGNGFFVSEDVRGEKRCVSKFGRSENI